MRNFSENLEKFAEGFHEIIERNLWRLRAKLTPKASHRSQAHSVTASGHSAFTQLLTRIPAASVMKGNNRRRVGRGPAVVAAAAAAVLRYVAGPRGRAPRAPK